ncbi:MAG: hypothetical protein ACK46A_12575 [Akkermansiaceae bacterium]
MARHATRFKGIKDGFALSASNGNASKHIGLEDVTPDGAEAGSDNLCRGR